MLRRLKILDLKLVLPHMSWTMLLMWDTAPQPASLGRASDQPPCRLSTPANQMAA